MSLLIKIHRRHKRYPDHLLHGIFGKSAGRQGFHPWDQVQSILGNQVPSIISKQGDHGGLTLVDFNLGVPPICPFAMPSLPNFHLSLAELGMQQNKPNQSQRVKPPWSPCMGQIIAHLLITQRQRAFISFPLFYRPRHRTPSPS